MNGLKKEKETSISDKLVSPRPIENEKYDKKRDFTFFKIE